MCSRRPEWFDTLANPKVTREFGYTLDTQASPPIHDFVVKDGTFHELDTLAVTNPASWPYRSDLMDVVKVAAPRSADPPIAVELPTGELAYYDLIDDPDAESIFNWMHGYMWGKLC